MALLVLACNCGDPAKTAFEQAKASDTIPAWQAFLEQHSESQFAARASTALEALRLAAAWSAARGADTIEQWESFLREYPETGHTAEATSALAARRMAAAWTAATAADTIEAYAQFRARFAGNTRSEEIADRIAAVARRGLGALTDSTACMSYLTQYPRSKHAAEVRAALEPLLFGACMDGGDIAACNDYVRLFPAGPHRKDVDKRHDQLKFIGRLKAARAADTFEAYSDVVLAHPDQDQLVSFAGGIGGYLDYQIGIDELCPDDKPELVRLATAQGVAVDKIKVFRGVHVGAPPNDAGAKAAGSKRYDGRKVREDCYPIPAWAVARMNLFASTVTVEKGANATVTRTKTDFSAGANKVFTFIGIKVGDKYRIVAAKYEHSVEK